MRNLRVVFLPRYRGNPYLRQLDVHLSALGIRVGGGGRSVVSVLKGLARERPHVLHLHWLDAFHIAPTGLQSLCRAIFSLTGLFVLRLLGVRTVWTVHNLRDHENRNPRLDRICTTFVATHADAIIVHGQTAKRQLIAEFGLRDKTRISVLPHGHYINCYENRIGRAQARKLLGIPDSSVVLLFLGQIRPYKGVLELVDAFRQLKCPGARLIIAGKPWTDESTGLLTQKTAGHASIRFVPGFVADAQIQVYMNACDAVVLPYRDILTSGAAVLAMSFGRVCVAPRLGCICDILDDEGAFLYDPNVPDGLLQALESTIESRADLERMGAHNRRLAERWDWQHIAERTLDIYRRICPAGAVRGAWPQPL